MNAIIFGGSNYQNLAERVARHARYELGELFVKRFPDNEIYVRLLSSVEGRDCTVIQSTRTNDELIELIFILDALKDMKAKKITAVVPYLGYARQDKRSKPGEAISAKTVLKQIDNYSDRILTLNCHFLNEEGEHDVSQYFGIQNQKLVLNNLDAFPIVTEYFKEKFVKENVVIISPDKGASQYAKKAAQIIGCGFDHLEKTRISSRKVKIDGKNLSVKGKDVLMLDDMISTGGTVIEAAKVLREAGARSVRAGCVHGVFAEGIENLLEAVDELACTNTLNTPVNKIDVSELIAKNL
ncbi:MAG: ribose-phosphate diphosphokinase [Nanoarchaeota archaeon]|nr:ribose-phosphate diphosphokinase [Nanoarchaeota archaeon]